MLANHVHVERSLLEVKTTYNKNPKQSNRRIEHQGISLPKR
jgi:hypothetical protein